MGDPTNYYITVLLLLIDGVWQNGDVYKPRDEKHSVYHYHYTTWPDKALPSSPKTLVYFLSEVLGSQMSFCDAGPVVVHCRYLLTVSHSHLLFVVPIIIIIIIIIITNLGFSAHWSLMLL